MDNLQRDGGTNRELERDKYDLEFRKGELEQELRVCNAKLQEINTELRRRERVAEIQQHGEETDEQQAARLLNYNGQSPLWLTTFTIDLAVATPLIERGKIRIVSGYNDQVICVWIPQQTDGDEKEAQP
jgi:hypothetical protein